MSAVGQVCLAPRQGDTDAQNGRSRVAAALPHKPDQGQAGGHLYLDLADSREFIWKLIPTKKDGQS